MKAILLSLTVAASFPVWFWSFKRLTDRSDDPLGLLALPTVVVVALLSTKQRTDDLGGQHLDWLQSILVSSSLIAFAATAELLPMLVRGAFAVTAVALLVSRICFSSRINMSVWGLCLLSLPVVATMQFYLGYPMRLLVAKVVILFLSTGGFAVAQSGTDINFQEHIIGIDPSCSGVRMLWTGLFAAFALAGFLRLSSARTFLLSLLTVLVVLCSNIVRATGLFLVEVRSDRLQMSAPDWLHSGVGMLAFASALMIVALIANKLSNTNCEGGRTSAAQSCAKNFDSSRSNGQCWPTFALIALCTTLILVGLFAFNEPKAPSRAVAASTQIPSTLDGSAVREIALTSEETSFAQAFPGSIHKLTDGHRQFILRKVLTATRQLHPAEDCFRGSGYQIRTRPNFHDGKKVSWGQFEATKDNVCLIVRERIYDDAGQSWTDVSAWYWAAVFGKTHAPWHTLTIAEPK